MHSILAEEKKFRIIFTQLLMQTRNTRKYLDLHFFFQPRNDNQWKLYLVNFVPYAILLIVTFYSSQIIGFPSSIYILSKRQCWIHAAMPCRPTTKATFTLWSPPSWRTAGPSWGRPTNTSRPLQSGSPKCREADTIHSLISRVKGFLSWQS